MKTKNKTFVVYELSFPSSDSCYIGKTYDVEHRIQSHKYIALKKREKNHRANWIRKHINEKPIVKILFKTKDEIEAYRKELYFIKKYITSNRPIVNTQRCKEAGGLSQRRIVSKETKEILRKKLGRKYVLIDNAGKIHKAHGLKSWAEERNLNYKDLNNVARNKFHCSQGFRVFYRENWQTLSVIEKKAIIKEFKSGKFRENIKKSALNKLVNKIAKKYIIIDKNSNFIRATNLEKFSRENNLNAGNMHNTTHKRNRVCNGYKAFLEEEFNNLSKKELQHYKKLVTKYKNSNWNKENICQ